MADTTRFERSRAVDVQKFLDDARSLKSRLQTIDLARLEDQRQAALDGTLKDTQHRGRIGGSDGLGKGREDSRRYVEAEHENSKALLLAKYEKFDVALEAVAKMLWDVEPLRQLEARRAQDEERLRKLEDQLNVRKKVLDHESTLLDQEKQLLELSTKSLAKEKDELKAKLANLEVVQRAHDLDEREKDLLRKIDAYSAEMSALAKMREEFYKDMDKLGEKRAELHREAEELHAEREKMREDRDRMGEVVAREMAATFETFIRDMFRPQPKT